MALLSYDLVQEILEVADAYTAEMKERLGRAGADAPPPAPHATRRGSSRATTSARAPRPATEQGG